MARQLVRVGAAPKIKLQLPPLSFAWSLAAHNYGGVSGWVSLNLQTGAPAPAGSEGTSMVMTKPGFCAHLSQLPISGTGGDPVIEVTARLLNGQLLHAPWKNYLSVVRQQLGCG